MGTPPGWYPDPGGCWEERWWDGRAWTVNVRTGQYQTQEPYPGGTPPQPGTPVFDIPSRHPGPRPDRYLLCWDSVRIHRRGSPEPSDVIPIWGIASIEVRTTIGAHALGLADVALEVRYAGYYGPTTFVLKAVDNAHWLKAMIRRQIGLWATHR